jgi:hypothetical protein
MKSGRPHIGMTVRPVGGTTTGDQKLPQPPELWSPKADPHTTQQKVIGHATRTSRFASFVVPQLTRVGLGVDAPVGSQIGAVLGSRRAHTAEFRCGGS